MPNFDDVVAEARLELADLSPALALFYADRVHRRLCALWPELCRGTSTVPLVAGVREYDLSPNVILIDGATFGPGTGIAVPVMRETMESIRAQDPAWRLKGAEDWSESGVAMYVTTRKVGSDRVSSIGFWPPPDATSAGGSLTLYTSETPQSDVVGADAILPGLHSIRVYVEGVLYHASRAIRPAAAANYLSAYTQEINESGLILRTRSDVRADERGSRDGG